MEQKYKVVNGTSYHEETPQEVINCLEHARANDIRLRIYLGDTATGKCWNDEHDIFGYINRSTGTIKIPLFIANSRSLGGGGLLDHCILKIKESKGKRIFYTHPLFKQSTFEIKASTETGYTHALYIDGELYSHHKSLKSAEQLKRRLL